MVSSRSPISRSRSASDSTASSSRSSSPTLSRTPWYSSQSNPVFASLEIRALAMDKIDTVYAAMRAAAEAIASDTGTRFGAEPFYVSHAAPTDERIRVLIERAAEQVNAGSRRLPSGAGHDAQSIARFAPIGMIFVPSVNGVSHSPEEFSRPEDIVRGADVLLLTLLAMDRADWK